MGRPINLFYIVLQSDWLWDNSVWLAGAIIIFFPQFPIILQKYIYIYLSPQSRKLSEKVQIKHLIGYLTAEGIFHFKWLHYFCQVLTPKHNNKKKKKKRKKKMKKKKKNFRSPSKPRFTRCFTRIKLTTVNQSN